MIFFKSFSECNNNNINSTDKKKYFNVKHANVPLNYLNIYLKYQGVVSVNH